MCNEIELPDFVALRNFSEAFPGEPIFQEGQEDRLASNATCNESQDV